MIRTQAQTLLLVLLAASPALANSIWTEDCNLTPKSSFGIDEAVCGQGDLDTQCNGSIIAAGDIWIVPTGAPNYQNSPTVPKHIVTAGGAGGFWGEYLWLPDLDPGTYDLMIDEDCDGAWDPGLDLRVTNAFTVTSVVTGANIDVVAIKAAALAEATRWGQIQAGWNLTMAVVSLVGKVNTFASALAGETSVQPPAA